MLTQSNCLFMYAFALRSNNHLIGNDIVFVFVLTFTFEDIVLQANDLAL